MSTLAPGQSVGRYKIVRFLGAGAMGEVYLADDPQIDRRLAIKTVRLTGRESDVDDRKRRLLREARAAGRMLHPNIVTLFDAGEAEGLLFLAFEYVEGRDLASRVEAPERLTLREVLRIGRYVAEALEYAHRQGIVHRDIKPGNILLDAKGGVKVADFGIAKVAGQETELTMAGSVLGSPQYLSPEQIRGEDLDGRSDLFSLGVVLYEILSRKRPFVGDTLTTLCYSILTKEPPPLSDLRAVPARLESLIGRMLAKDRDDRIGTAAEVARELSAIELDLAEETLLAPAGGESEKTTVLPRRSTTGAGPLPPPPPLVSPSTKLTAQPGGVATTETPAAGGAPREFVPPPPPVSMPQAPSERPASVPAAGRAVQPPVLPPPAPGSITPPLVKPAMGTGVKALIVFGALALLLTVGSLGGWMVARRFGLLGGPDQSGEATPAPASSEVDASEATSVGAHELSASGPPSRPPSETASGMTPPGASPTGSAQDRSGGTNLGGGTPKLESGPVPAEPVRGGEALPPRSTPQNRGEAPVVVSPPRLMPNSEPTPAPAPIPREPEVSRPETRLAPADRTLASGLQATFQVEPPDAFVVVDGTVLGRAAEWAGGKKGKVYSFPGADTYRIKVKRDGMRTAEIEVEVSERGGVTPISVRLRPLSGANAESEQLSIFRTSDAISFKVRPATASFSVDGVPKGPTQRYSGGFGHSGWLSLPAGKHRISVTAPGYQQQDVVVDVTGSASDEKVPITLNLVQGG